MQQGGVFVKSFRSGFAWGKFLYSGGVDFAEWFSCLVGLSGMDTHFRFGERRVTSVFAFLVFTSGRLRGAVVNALVLFVFWYANDLCDAFRIVGVVRIGREEGLPEKRDGNIWVGGIAFVWCFA